MSTKPNPIATWTTVAVAGLVLVIACPLFAQSPTATGDPPVQVGQIPSVEAASLTAKSVRRLLVVVGAAGEERYGAMFAEWRDKWLSQAAEAGLVGESISGMVDDKSPRDQLIARLGEFAADHALEEAWIVLIGHGTFNGKVARFNLTGPDISDAEFFNLIRDRKQLTVVINCTSSSSPFITANNNPGCLVVTATRDGFEENFCHFGKYFVDAVMDSANDLDKDQQVSLLEAFIAAGKATSSFYATEKRLATEHALIDDNGDRLGTPAEWFKGIRLSVEVKDQKAADGLRANRVFFNPGKIERQLSVEQRAERDRLEAEIEALRERKNRMDEDDYYRQLETILVQLARLYFPVPAPDKQ
jgi:hypothetical protein